MCFEGIEGRSLLLDWTGNEKEESRVTEKGLVHSTEGGRRAVMGCHHSGRVELRCQLGTRVQMCKRQL